jgi:hypothetical protein
VAGRIRSSESGCGPGEVWPGVWRGKPLLVFWARSPGVQCIAPKERRSGKARRLRGLAAAGQHVPR